MSVSYQLIRNPITGKIDWHAIKKIEDGNVTYVHILGWNKDFQDYLEWEATEGNHIQDPE